MNERHVRWLLVLVLIVQLVLVSVQVRETALRGTYLEVALLRLAGPVARMVAAASNGLAAVGHALGTRNRLLKENRELTRRVEELRRERIRAFGLEQEVDRLSRAVEYFRRADEPLRVADIVWIDHASFFQTLVLRVEEGHVKTNHPVVAAEGLVGRVVVTAGPYAKVQLITDRAASVGAMIERTRRQGVARGAGAGVLELDFVPLQEEVQIGDRVITAGIDGIYPRGLPVGTVVAVKPGSELFHDIRLRPAVNFGLLDQVYVLESELVPERTKDLSPDARP